MHWIPERGSRGALVEKLALIPTIAKPLLEELAFLLAFPFTPRAGGPRGCAASARSARPTSRHFMLVRAFVFVATTVPNEVDAETLRHSFLLW